MKFFNKYNIGWLALMLFAIACKKSFLDEKPEGSITPVSFYKPAALFRCSSVAVVAFV